MSPTREPLSAEDTSAEDSSNLDANDDHDIAAPSQVHFHSRMSAAKKQEALRLAQEADQGVDPFSYRGFTFGLIVLIVCFCSGDTGMDATIMSAINSMTQYQEYFHIAAASKETGLVFGIYTVGQAVAVIPTAYLPDRLGRRWCMLVGNMILISGALMTANATSMLMFITGRFWTGLGCTVAATSAKSYLAEITSPATRGRFMGLLNSFFYVGQLAASGIAVHTGRYTTDWAWRAPLYVQAVPALLNALFVLRLPESPRWLWSSGKTEKAAQVLANLHSRDKDVNSPLIQLEIREIEESIIPMNGSRRAWWDFRVLFRDAASRYRIYLCMIVSVWGQLSGNGLITYFLPILLHQAGITDPDRQRVLNVVSSVTSFMGALTGTAIIDHMGRRVLMLFSSTASCLGMSIIGGLLSPYGAQSQTRATAGITFIYLFMVFFSVGWTPIQAVYPTEVLSFEMRGMGLAFQSLVTQGVSCINTFGMPVVLKILTWKTYIIFSLFDALGVFVVWMLAVETKQLSLEEMDAVFESENPRKFAAAMSREATTRAPAD